MIESHASSAASVEGLWAVVADVTAWPRHLPTFRAVTHLSDSAVGGLGSRFEVRQPGLPVATYEVTEWVPGASFTWVARSPGVVTVARHAITALETGSRLDLHVEWDGPLAPPLRLLVRRRAQRMIDLEATTLARVARSCE